MKIKSDPDNGTMDFDGVGGGKFVLTVTEERTGRGHIEARLLLDAAETRRIITKLKKRLKQMEALA